MLAVELMLALEYPSVTVAVVFGVLLVLVLAFALLVPYLMEELKRGKVNLGPRFPTGTGDTHPGTRANPAPGQPDGQPDPYKAR
jgi:hypothetical protein